nr:MAG TPA: Helix-turn-helix XRE-family like protein [Caudoviricetes sp.]
MNNRLKEFRESKNMTQEKFAQTVGTITRSHISNIERGALASDRVIKDICEAFNLNPNWLKYGEHPQFIESLPDDELGTLFGELLSSEDEFKKKLIKTLLKLDVDELKVIKKIAEDLTK